MRITPELTDTAVAHGFERLLPDLPPSPIAQLKLRGKQRQRVSHPRGRNGVIARARS